MATTEHVAWERLEPQDGRVAYWVRAYGGQAYIRQVGSRWRARAWLRRWCCEREYGSASAAKRGVLTFLRGTTDRCT